MEETWYWAERQYQRNERLPSQHHPNRNWTAESKWITSEKRAEEQASRWCHWQEISIWVRKKEASCSSDFQPTPQHTAGSQTKMTQPNSGPPTPGPAHVLLYLGKNMLLYLMEPQIQQWQLVGYTDKEPGASLGFHSKQERHKGNIAQKPPEPPATGQKLSAAGSVIFCHRELSWPFFKHYWHSNSCSNTVRPSAAH